MRKRAVFGRIRYIMKRNWMLLLLTLPAVAYFLLFNYAPMFGLIMAFKRYSYRLGIILSPWNGLKNFEAFFRSVDFGRVVRNTVLYSLAFILAGVTVNVAVALLLNEVRSRKCVKFYQTVMTIPNFLSWVIVGFITYALLNPNIGVLNTMLTRLGLARVNWFGVRPPWPWILTLCYIWKGVGMGSIVYYATLIGIDAMLYEAATIDGAGKWQMTWHISIPSLIPVMTIVTILAIGGLFRGDFGLFYQIPRNVGILYPVTDVIDTYIFRGLRSGDLGSSSAVGLVQSLLGLIMVLATNAAVRRISPENALF